MVVESVEHGVLLSKCQARRMKRKESHAYNEIERPAKACYSMAWAVGSNLAVFRSSWRTYVCLPFLGLAPMS